MAQSKDIAGSLSRYPSPPDATPELVDVPRYQNVTGLRVLRLTAMYIRWVLVTWFAILTAVVGEQLPLISDRPLGLDYSQLVSIPSIIDWTASPNGEAAAINLRTFDPITKTAKNVLWILPVNAQFTVEPQPMFDITPNTLFTWLSNTTLALLRPTGTTSWDLVTATVNYTITPPAYPPTVGPLRVLKSFPVLVLPAKLKYASGVLGLVTNAYDDEDLETIPEQDQEDVEAGQGWTGGWVYEGTWPRHWDTWTRRKQPRLFLIDLEVTGKDEWALKSDVLRTPLKGTGIVPTDIKLSSGSIAVVAKDPTVHKAFHSRTNIYLVPLHGTTPPVLISSGNGGESSSPVFNGNKVAWLEQAEDGDVVAQRHVWIWDRQKDVKWRVDGQDFAFNPHQLEFSLNGEALFLLTEHHTETSLFHIWTPESPESGPVHATLIPTNGTIHDTVHVGITPLEHSHLISLKSFSDAPPELYMTSHSPYSDPDGNLEEIKLTHFASDDNSAGLSVGEPFWVGQVQSRIFLPREGLQVPLVVLLHDGPGASWKNEWTANWNPNVFTSYGYAVLQVNPSGSSGYSEDFAHAMSGGASIADLKQTLAHVLHDNFKYSSRIDRSRLFAVGVGYGGYLVNWINGHNEDFGFKALVTDGGIFSTSVIAYETDEVYRMNRVFNESNSSKWDPKSGVDKWKTPTLVIHGGKDYRVPESQGIATFNALQRQRVPSRMLYFPTEGHLIAGEENIMKWYFEVVRFFHDYGA